MIRGNTEAAQRGSRGRTTPSLTCLYWAVGNPAADFYGEEREGDNLYTDSVVALDPDTGELKWHYQQIPHDVWDFDTAYEIVLLDLEVEGQEEEDATQPFEVGLRLAPGSRDRRVPWRVAPSGEFQLDRRHRPKRGADRKKRAPRGRGELRLPGHRRWTELEPRGLLAGYGLVLFDGTGMVPDTRRAQGGAAGGHAVLRRRFQDGTPEGRKGSLRTCRPTTL